MASLGGSSHAGTDSTSHASWSGSGKQDDARSAGWTCTWPTGRQLAVGQRVRLERQRPRRAERMRSRATSDLQAGAMDGPWGGRAVLAAHATPR
mmetsp:Transcript_123018/g.307223  ORF Transcript_123018/g.307223 Transcript_123018/m.307223 type:complete len:94 (-) Transcript_123018:152-433(-)